MAKAGSYRPAMAANALKTGSPNKPNWSPAISEISLDIRPAPWTAPMEVKYWFDEIMTFWISDPNLLISESYARYKETEAIPFLHYFLL